MTSKLATAVLLPVLAIVALAVPAGAGTVVFDEDFESYADGALTAQSTWFAAFGDSDEVNLATGLGLTNRAVDGSTGTDTVATNIAHGIATQTFGSGVVDRILTFQARNWTGSASPGIQIRNGTTQVFNVHPMGDNKWRVNNTAVTTNTFNPSQVIDVEATIDMVSKSVTAKFT